MEVGTIKTEVDAKKKRRSRVSFSEGMGKSGGNGKNGGGGGGNDDNNPPDQENYEELEQNPPDKSRILTAFLLLVVLMTFGGLIGAYIVISSNGVLEWRPFDLPVQVWISTAIILASSATYYIAAKSLYQEEQEKSKTWFLVTTALGATFISSQILAWFALYRSGIYMQSNPYAGFFYILTAVHAVHVLGGISALGAVVLRTWNKTFSSEELKSRQNLSNVVGWYWHTMDGLWLVLLVLLGFWK